MSKRNFMKAAAGITAALAAASLVGKANASGLGPVLAIISHPVKDYAAWRKVYDSAEPLRQQAGITGAEVFRDPKDEKLLTIIHRFPTLDAAQGFLGNPDLKDAMMKAGVSAPPTVTVAAAV
jgi:quinol monooxygenase YgiN